MCLCLCASVCVCMCEIASPNDLDLEGINAFVQNPHFPFIHYVRFHLISSVSTSQILNWAFAPSDWIVSLVCCCCCCCFFCCSFPSERAEVNSTTDQGRSGQIRAAHATENGQIEINWCENGAIFQATGSFLGFCLS